MLLCMSLSKILSVNLTAFTQFCVAMQVFRHIRQYLYGIDEKQFIESLAQVRLIFSGF
jgi:hypothetical protein